MIFAPFNNNISPENLCCIRNSFPGHANAFYRSCACFVYIISGTSVQPNAGCVSKRLNPKRHRFSVVISNLVSVTSILTRVFGCEPEICWISIMFKFNQWFEHMVLEELCDCVPGIAYVRMFLRNPSGKWRLCAWNSYKSDRLTPALGTTCSDPISPNPPITCRNTCHVMHPFRIGNCDQQKKTMHAWWNTEHWLSDYWSKGEFMINLFCRLHINSHTREINYGIF